MCCQNELFILTKRAAFKTFCSAVINRTIKLSKITNLIEFLVISQTIAQLHYSSNNINKMHVFMQTETESWKKVVKGGLKNAALDKINLTS